MAEKGGDSYYLDGATKNFAHHAQQRAAENTVVLVLALQHALNVKQKRIEQLKRNNLNVKSEKREKQNMRLHPPKAAGSKGFPARPRRQKGLWIPSAATQPSRWPPWSTWSELRPHAFCAEEKGHVRRKRKLIGIGCWLPC